MNDLCFNRVLFGAYLVLGLQVIVADLTGWLYRGQLKDRGEEGYPLLEHGGFWADMALISWLCALIAGYHDLRFATKGGLVTLAIVVAAIAYMVKRYEKLPFREAYQHDGRTTVAGWLHALYAVGAAWILARFYLGNISPRPSAGELVLVSTGMTVFFPIGLAKFGGGWKLREDDAIQALIRIAIVWSIVIIRMAIA